MTANSARTLRGVAVALVCALFAAGCTSGSSVLPQASTSASAEAPSPVVPASLSVTPADQAVDVLPSEHVSVAALSGKVDKVTVTDETGEALEGVVDSAGTWTSTRNLRPAASYTIAIEAVGPSGAETTVTQSFATLKPKTIATYGINYSGATVGVGMPVAIQFDTPVTTAEFRAEVERLVSVTTEPATEGSWGWLDSRQLMWRPKDYWVPGTKVTVDAPLRGVQTGDDKWIGADENGGFTIGDSRISTVDMSTHQMTVTLNGAVQRVIPVSTGKPGGETETRAGTKVIIERQSEIVMDSATVGIPEGDPGYYKIPTNWNLRVTWTGEFLHSAPWSVDAQGTANVSHGCTNMAPDQAEWMFNFSRAGDVVKFIGGDRPFLPTEGIGVWEYSYEGWRAQSALAGTNA